MPDAFLFFTEKTAATFRAAAGRIVPSEPGSPGADCDAAMKIADHALFERPDRDRKLLGTFLSAVEWLPVLRYGRAFTRLSPAEQDIFLRFLETNRVFSKFRQGFFGLKAFALMGYYGMDETFRELGYPGPRLDAPYYQLRIKDG